VDPITLLATANACVAAVKKGIALYKDIKGTAGEVKDVLKDLKAQYDQLVAPTPQQKQQYNEEVQRVQTIAKSDPNDVFTEIGDQLGALMDAYDALGKALIAEETSSKKVYKGEESIGRRALRRIIISARLDAMLTEIREMMVYHAPPELGSLWSKFEAMWQKIVAEQEVAHAEEMRQFQIAQWRRKKAIEEAKAKAAWSLAVVFVLLYGMGLMWLTKRSMTMYLGLS
jgi:hypothetical protein